MRKNKLTVWSGMALIMAIAAVAGGLALFKTPEIRLPKKLEVSIVSIAPEKGVIKMVAPCYNPNPIGFTFTGGTLTIKLNDFVLGQVKIDTVMQVPAHGGFNVPVVIEPDFLKLGESGLNFGDSIRISVDGKMKGRVGPVSKTVTIQYVGKHYLDLNVPGAPAPAAAPDWKAQ